MFILQSRPPPHVMRPAQRETEFEAPTLVQAQAIPVVPSGRHTLVNAATGIGKTVAYLAPIIHMLQNYDERIQRADDTFENPVMIGLDDKMLQSNGVDIVKESRKPLDTSNEEYKLSAQLVQKYIKVPCGSWLVVLLSILKHLFETGASQKVAVFFSTCDAVDFHYSLLSEFQWTAMKQTNTEVSQKFLSCKMLRLHGNMNHEDRKTTFQAFKTDKSVLLFSTDVCARGLDFPEVRFIIQYDSPGEATEYVHR